MGAGATEGEGGIYVGVLYTRMRRRRMRGVSESVGG